MTWFHLIRPISPLENCGLLCLGDSFGPGRRTERLCSSSPLEPMVSSCQCGRDGLPGPRTEVGTPGGDTRGGPRLSRQRLHTLLRTLHPPVPALPLYREHIARAYLLCRQQACQRRDQITFNRAF